MQNNACKSDLQNKIGLSFFRNTFQNNLELSFNKDQKSPNDGFEGGFAVCSPDGNLKNEVVDHSQSFNSLIMNCFNDDYGEH